MFIPSKPNRFLAFKHRRQLGAKVILDLQPCNGWLALPFFGKKHILCKYIGWGAGLSLVLFRSRWSPFDSMEYRTCWKMRQSIHPSNFLFQETFDLCKFGMQKSSIISQTNGIIWHLRQKSRDKINQVRAMSLVGRQKASKTSGRSNMASSPLVVKLKEPKTWSEGAATPSWTLRDGFLGAVKNNLGVEMFYV